MRQNYSLKKKACQVFILTNFYKSFEIYKAGLLQIRHLSEIFKNMQIFSFKKAFKIRKIHIFSLNLTLILRFYIRIFYFRSFDAFKFLRYCERLCLAAICEFKFIKNQTCGVLFFVKILWIASPLQS